MNGPGGPSAATNSAAFGQGGPREGGTNYRVTVLCTDATRTLPHISGRQRLQLCNTRSKYDLSSFAIIFL